MVQHYNKVLHEYDMGIERVLMQCYMNPECKDFETTFSTNERVEKIHTLYVKDEVYMLFKNNNFYLQMNMNKDKYINRQEEIKNHILIEYVVYLLILGLISFLFALYAIRPLKKALILNEEFVKDILHDFNTPLSSLKINLTLLKKKFGEDDALQRGEEAISNILSLQDNLHYYISQSKLQNQDLNLDEIIKERAFHFQALFPKLNINTNTSKCVIYANQDVVIRIIDNLISNACKYNKENGEVNLNLENNILTIRDTGIGIKDPQSIFKRYYKETPKGTGIGLHIVKKLSTELNISIEVKSSINIGSTFVLNFSKVILR